MPLDMFSNIHNQIASEQSGLSLEKFIKQNGNKYEFQFEKTDADNLKISYSGGKQFRIFNTILKIIQDFIKNHKVLEIEFSANTKEPSRVSLYNKLIEKFTNDYGFKLFRTQNIGTFIIYQFTKNIKPLTESIVIQPSDITKIQKALEAFKQNVNDYEFLLNDEPELLYKKGEILIKKTIDEILQPFYGFQNHIVKVKIVNDYNHGATVGGRWVNHNGTWYNQMTINISQEKLKNLNVKEYTNIITHELTHLIQSLNAKNHDSSTTKNYKSSDAYYGKSIEIDAYAQSVASNILSDIIKNNGKNTLAYAPEIRKFIELLKSQKNVYRPNPNLEHYNAYKQIFKKASSKNDWNIWKRFNKKIIEKLSKYIESYTLKNTSTKFNVYLNDELIDTVWYDSSYDTDDLKRSLVVHDDYDPRIVVKRTRRPL
jgi:predicted metallopeptidase